MHPVFTLFDAISEAVAGGQQTAPSVKTWKTSRGYVKKWDELNFSDRNVKLKAKPGCANRIVLFWGGEKAKIEQEHRFFLATRPVGDLNE